MEAMNVYNLRCRTCSWKQMHVVSAEYAQELCARHEFRYFEHSVAVAG